MTSSVPRSEAGTRVRARRAPKLPVFIGLGLALGALTGLAVAVTPVSYTHLRAHET